MITMFAFALTCSALTFYFSLKWGGRNIYFAGCAFNSVLALLFGSLFGFIISVELGSYFIPAKWTLESKGGLGAGDGGGMNRSSLLKTGGDSYLYFTKDNEQQNIVLNSITILEEEIEYGGEDGEVRSENTFKKYFLKKKFKWLFFYTPKCIKNKVVVQRRYFVVDVI